MKIPTLLQISLKETGSHSVANDCPWLFGYRTSLYIHSYIRPPKSYTGNSYGPSCNPNRIAGSGTILEAQAVLALQRYPRSPPGDRDNRYFEIFFRTPVSMQQHDFAGLYSLDSPWSTTTRGFQNSMVTRTSV